MMRARSTRFAGSVRDREISTSARRWSASTDKAIIRRAATMAPPAIAIALHTTYRKNQAPSHNISTIWNLSTSFSESIPNCDLTDNEPVQQLLWNMSSWNDRFRGWLFNPNRLAPTYPESPVDRVFRYNAFYLRIRARARSRPPTSWSERIGRGQAAIGCWTSFISCRKPHRVGSALFLYRDQTGALHRLRRLRGVKLPV